MRDRQRGLVTYALLIVVVAVVPGLAIAPAITSQLISYYDDATVCLQAVDEFNSAMAATRAGESAGVVRIEWKARCVRVDDVRTAV